MMALLQVLAAYILGSIPTAYIAGRWLKRLDIRQHGSGNVGATNVFRVLGTAPGVAVLTVDIAKGWAAAYLLPRLGAPSGAIAWTSDSPMQQAWWPCLLGLVAVLGHSYTCFLAFKGGKGVATSAGVFLGLAPLATLWVIAIFIALFSATRMVSVGSLGASLALPALVFYFKEWRPGGSVPTLADQFRNSFDPLSKPVLWLAAAVTILIWVRHLPNIQRIAAGTESRFGKRKEA